MLTKKDLKAQYGDNITFLFKGTDPFTETDNGKPAGVLIERDGKVQCYECGKWFKQLAAHIVAKHKRFTCVDDYKEKYGFNRGAGLCSKETSRKFSDNSIKNQTGASYEKNFLRKSMGHQKKHRMQSKNGSNTCPEQIKKRLELLLAKFGDTITVKEAQGIDGVATLWAMKKYGTWNKMKRELGTPVNTHYRANEANLIYSLREYVKKNHYLPWYTYSYGEFKPGNKRNGFSYGMTTYVDHFGSRVKAYLHCGVVKTDKWVELEGKRLKYLDVLN